MYFRSAIHVQPCARRGKLRPISRDQAQQVSIEVMQLPEHPLRRAQVDKVDRLDGHGHLRNHAASVGCGRLVLRNHRGKQKTAKKPMRSMWNGAIPYPCVRTCWLVFDSSVTVSTPGGQRRCTGSHSCSAAISRTRQPRQRSTACTCKGSAPAVASLRSRAERRRTTFHAAVRTNGGTGNQTGARPPLRRLSPARSLTCTI